MAQTHGRRVSSAATAWGLRLATIIVFAGLWELSTFRLQSLLLPTFTQTIGGLYQLMFVSGRLWEPLFLSNQALVLGYLLSVGVGVPLGLAMARSRPIERILSPYVSILLAAPVAPLIPIIMMALGLELASRTCLVFLFAFIFIAVNTRAGVRNVDPSLIEMAHSFGANEWEVWRRILIPGAMPSILAGLRIGLGRAVTGMVIAELLLVGTGVGKLMLEFRGLFQKDLLFAVVLAVLVESMLLMAAMRILERRIAPGVTQIATD